MFAYVFLGVVLGFFGRLFIETLAKRIKKGKPVFTVTPSVIIGGGGGENPEEKGNEQPVV